MTQLWRAHGKDTTFLRHPFRLRQRRWIRNDFRWQWATNEALQDNNDVKNNNLRRKWLFSLISNSCSLLLSFFHTGYMKHPHERLHFLQFLVLTICATLHDVMLLWSLMISSYLPRDKHDAFKCNWLIDFPFILPQSLDCCPLEIWLKEAREVQIFHFLWA